MMSAKISITTDFTAKVDQEELLHLLFTALRSRALLRFDDPDDDHTNLSITSQDFRSRLREVVETVSKELTFTIEVD